MLDLSNIFTIKLWWEFILAPCSVLYCYAKRILLQWLCYFHKFRFTSIGFINGITKYPFHYVYHIENSFINNRLVPAFEHPRYLKFSWQFVEVVYKCQTKWAAKLWWTEMWDQTGKCRYPCSDRGCS
jgi:hypothetical protein